VKRATAAALFAVFLLAILVRLLPLLRYQFWGSDFGEYYVLTRAIAEEGALPSAYRGWGVTYPYFPGMFALNGAFVILGAPAGIAASVLVPVIASLGVLPVFLIAARVTGDDLAGLVAAAFLAVSMFHVFPTSHGIPAALGDLLLLTSLLLFLGIRRSLRFVPLVLLAGFSVIVTHHLTAYFLILLASSALVLRAALDRNLTLRDIQGEVTALAVLGAATLAFWAFYATPLWTLIVQNSPASGPVLVGGTALAVMAAPSVLVLRRRTSWRYRPRVRTVRGAALGAGLAFATSVVFVIVVGTGSVPGTSLRIPLAETAPYMAMLAFVSLSAAGRRTMDLSREGPDVTAWFVALVASLVAGVLAAPEVLIPNRHLQYFMIPFAVLAGAGLRWLTVGTERRGRIAAASAAILLIGATAIGAYPPPGTLGHQEGIAARTVDTALWVGDHADGLVAADHRLSSILFGFGGVDATWDREVRFWHTADLNVTLAALSNVSTPDGRTRVDWVVVDEDLRAGVQLSPFAPALPLLPSEEEKFATSPFHKMYDSGFSEVYLVNWGLVP